MRRLEVGLELARLLRDVHEVGAQNARLDARLERAEPFLLRADGDPVRLDGVRRLDMLTDPPRDLKTLTLAGATDQDPLGRRLRVRAWTLGEPYAADELAHASHTLEHIARCVGRDVEGGIDVLITPRMGFDVFRLQGIPPVRAAGVYYRGDRYCVVESGLTPRFRVEVVKHELIHAYCHGAAKSLSKSRFITEGVAEYLRHLAPGDNGLNVPDARLKDTLAELQGMFDRLARANVNLKKVAPRRLVELEPEAFYQLGHMGYVVANACMAYVGGDVIHQALYRRTDAPIVDAVRALGWEEFLAFVKRGAREGRLGRAVVVADAPEFRRTAAGFAAALLEIGAEPPPPAELPDPELVMMASAAVLGNAERIGRVLRFLVDAPAGPRVFLDVSEAMDRPVRAAEPSLLLPAVPGGGETARQFAARFVDFLAAGRLRDVVTLGDPPRGGGREVLDAQQPLSFTGYFDLAREDRRFSVLILGSAELAALAPDPAPEAQAEGEVLLVVDLTPDGGAIQWARAFQEERRYVAYWSPLVEPE